MENKEKEVLLKVRGARTYFPIKKGLMKRTVGYVKAVDDISLDVYKGCSELFEEDLYNEIDLLTCVKKRISEGGTSVASVEAQISYVKECLA